MSGKLKKRVSIVAGMITTTAVAALALLAVAPPAQAATITSHAVINEVVSNPVTGDEWVEVHDPTGSTPGAIVCGLSTGSGAVLDSGCGHMTGEHLIRWSSDAIDDDGDTLMLFGSSSAEPIDTVTVPALAPGQSYARSHDGSTRWEIRDAADVTPNSSNGAAPMDLDPPLLSVSSPLSGEVAVGGFTLSYSASDPGSGVAAVAFYMREGDSTGAYAYQDTDLNTSFSDPFASIETFSSLMTGTYDLCVTAVDEEGNGAAVTTDITECDDALPHVVAIDDVEVRDETLPAPDPTVTALAPADGASVPASEIDLVWERVMDPSFVVLHQEVTIAASADLTVTPVRYRASGTMQTVPTAFLTPGETWWWQVSVVFARSAASPSESIVSEVRSFTVEDAAASPTPRFELNGVDWADYRSLRTRLDVCTLEVETFDIGALTALAEIESYGDGALTTLVAAQALHSGHDEHGSAGVWTFRLADHPTMAVPSEDGYVLQLRIFGDDGSTEFGWAEIVMPSSCLPAGAAGDADGSDVAADDASGDVAAGDANDEDDAVGDASAVRPALSSTGGDVGFLPLGGAAMMLVGMLLLALRRRAQRGER